MPHLAAQPSPSSAELLKPLSDQKKEESPATMKYQLKFSLINAEVILKFFKVQLMSH